MREGNGTPLQYSCLENPRDGCGQGCPDFVRSKFGAQRWVPECHGAPFSGISSVFTFRGSLKGLAPGRLLMRGQRCEFLGEISQVLNV